MHWWFEHTRPPVHPVQATPPSAHLSFVVPSTQLSPSQQPLQLFGPHGSLHLPAMHCCSPAQF